MFTPRNTLVAVELIEKSEKKIGGIVIPLNSELYCEGIVTGIGPGNIGADGARNETHDLVNGQTVLVQYKQVRPGPQGGLIQSKCGVEYTRDGKTFMLFEQANILAILKQPVGVASLIN